MRKILLLLLFATIHCVLSKNNVKSLTESLGQEVIEIGAPIKELPPDLEEEPSAENDEEYKPTTLTLPAGTKRDSKKTVTPTTVDTRRKYKDQNKTTTLKQEDEEARIEKELAEIYRDNIDYKSDSSEENKEVTSAKNEEEVDKPIGRSLSRSFKFQPDLENRAEVERFRTSVDEISCEQKNLMKGRGDQTTTKPNGACENSSASLLFCLITLLSVLILN